jgi:phosphoribosylformylglycinamidine synthase subunit PurL
MKTWELLLSESQERMLMVVEKGKEAEVLKIFEKWDLPCSEIGHVTEDGLLNFYMNGVLEASLPAWELVLGGGAPVYEREYAAPTYLDLNNQFNSDSIAVPTNLKEVAEKLIALPTIASKQYVYNQYDSMVGTGNTNTNAPSAAAIVLVKGTTKAIAITTDCNSRYVYANPKVGAMIAVAEAARNIVCSGGLPLGVTNCLNFGNPYNPEVYYQFVEAIQGMGEACRKFDTPVTGGNVSFYNQNPDGPVFPTPTIGMVGLLEDINDKMSLNFKAEGDIIYLLGAQKNDINSSQYLSKICGVHNSQAPYFNLDEEFTTMQVVQELIKQKLVQSANDVSEGGLIVSLLESGFTKELGFEIDTDANFRQDAFLFGENQGRYILSINPSKIAEFEAIAAKIPKLKLGKITDGQVKINAEFWGNILDWKTIYNNAIEHMMSYPTKKF